MPGSHVNDQQVRIYMRLRIDHMQVTAAAKAGFSVATARRIEHDPRPPSTKGPGPIARDRTRWPVIGTRWSCRCSRQPPVCAR